jgi:Cyclin M transmembrane N-terminal domain
MRQTVLVISLITIFLSEFGSIVFLIPISALSTTFFRQTGRYLRQNEDRSAARFKSDFPPETLVHRSYFLDAHITNETCTESCCSKHYQQFLDVNQCPVCEQCVSSNPLAFLPDAVQIVLIVFLVVVSGLFSGLTLGFLSLDKTGLEILMDSDDPSSASYARKIYPIRVKGNELLCTLLLGNTAANALLSILIADRFGGIVGALSSTFVILIFGEIVPQAICSRYALYIGSRAVPLVKCIMIIFYPIAKPLALALDYALGEELATTYSGKEFMKLLQIHVEENMLDHDTANTMTGALKYKNLPVREVMTPLANVFMLKTDEKLNFETIAKIFKTGYSRIPVYEVSQVCTRHPYPTFLRNSFSFLPVSLTFYTARPCQWRRTMLLVYFL